MKPTAQLRAHNTRKTSIFPTQRRHRFQARTHTDLQRCHRFQARQRVAPNRQAVHPLAHHCASY